MGALRGDSAWARSTAMRLCWEASELDEHFLPASVPMSLVRGTENDHHVRFDCH